MNMRHLMDLLRSSPLKGEARRGWAVDPPPSLPRKGGGVRFWFLVWLLVPSLSHADVRVVTTLPVLADIAKQVGGERVTVRFLAKPTEDVHTVIPRPSLMAAVSRADIFIEMGLQLETWTERVLEGAGNPRVLPGQIGHVTASDGIPLLEIPKILSRSEGDIHPSGNPHVWLNPLNGILIAENIVRGLKRVDPGGAADFDRNLETFTERIHVNVFGPDLVKSFGGRNLADHLRAGDLDFFLKQKNAQPRLAGWLAGSRKLGNFAAVSYHRLWSYWFEAMGGVRIVNTVEEKPGVPPSAAHRDRLLDQMNREGVRVILQESFEPISISRKIAAASGAKVVLLPSGVDPGAGRPDYFSLFDAILRILSAESGT